jgi:hypothetical protein
VGLLVLTPLVNRAQLCRGVQHGHDPVQRCERCYDGWHQEDQADVCEVVRSGASACSMTSLEIANPACLRLQVMARAPITSDLPDEQDHRCEQRLA